MSIRFACLVFILLLAVSCIKKKKDTVPAKCSGSYALDIKPIVNGKCALSGCHGTGSSLGDYTQFTELKWRADSGRVEKYVFELKIMPPANAIQLTEDEQAKFKCWLDNGAPFD